MIQAVHTWMTIDDLYDAIELREWHESWKRAHLANSKKGLK